MTKFGAALCAAILCFASTSCSNDSAKSSEKEPSASTAVGSDSKPKTSATKKSSETYEEQIARALKEEDACLLATAKVESSAGADPSVVAGRLTTMVDALAEAKSWLPKEMKVPAATLSKVYGQLATSMTKGDAKKTAQLATSEDMASSIKAVSVWTDKNCK